ncbi:hypothetical protein [Phaeobacter sp. HF9A]|uniref:hypothetical protein n=1 Tax=Phaeobacter sp. HF9A TaxID=2721561 RepID=UPI001430620E|nr:hypothetical protein [Phaeobacter sp. HF9A]NIZ15124.1 hypothetical protein [Phaeobacter sp. HF9A]
MPTSELIERACQMEERIRKAPEALRLGMQPEFSAIIARIKAAGAEIPPHLRRTEQILNEEMVESRFDNMPI